MASRAIVCPQCELHIELADRPCAYLGGPQVEACRCERCVAWIRIEGWSSWVPTHYSMTPFRDSVAALVAFPAGTWFAVADVSLVN